MSQDEINRFLSITNNVVNQHDLYKVNQTLKHKVDSDELQK